MFATFIMIILIFVFLGAIRKEEENKEAVNKFVDVLMRNVNNRQHSQMTYQVTNIIDGDTLDLNTNIRVRLSYIDAYEKNHPMHQKIMYYMNNMVLGKFVNVTFKGTDKYSRNLAVIYMPDGSCLNDTLVSMGYAGVYDKYCDRASDTYKRLKEKEQSAAVRQAAGVYKTVSYYRLLKDYFKF